jgi:fatty acid desaturase (delta-4 desaturase)
MDFIGSNNSYWFKQHIMQHHAFTNQSELDPDTIGGEPFFVIDPEKRYSHQKYRFPIIWMLGFTIVFNIPRLIKSKDLFGILLRIVFLIKVFHGGIFNAMIIIFTTGFILSNLFIISHNTDETRRNQNETCWYKFQVESSSTYGGYWAGLFTGGLNDQITHHVFPRMNSCYFPKIRKEIEEICKKHNVKYTYYETIFDNYKACYKFLSNTNENVETIQTWTDNKSE